ncbi:YqxA family protein [Mesobacillus zeae]|uniref:DUF3679 domain-containing protein n=1 Tax=Mesobacillus zeae TaxID=1917180 RepID=A0A398B4P0_9BACI|nr:YqxA family protein [Mesobacillus zeae]RID83788.1 DUF3679 domain-containing protein [Mesobacillus zeae]
MKMFMLKAFLLASVMFLCVLAGMQLANDGMDKMRGYEDPEFKNAFTVNKAADGKEEAAILGTEVSSNNFEEKKEKLEQMETYNFFSNLGKNLANFVSAVVENTIEVITGKDKSD